MLSGDEAVKRRTFAYFDRMPDALYMRDVDISLLAWIPLRKVRLDMRSGQWRQYINPRAEKQAGAGFRVSADAALRYIASVRGAR